MIFVVIVLAVHVLSSVFWAGSAFVLARLAGLGGERLVYPQAGAAGVAMLTGGYLWTALHDAGIGPAEQVLLVGIAAALIAFAVQAFGGFPALAGLRRGQLGEEPARKRIAAVQRVAAGFLAITVVCMAVARYV
ncbi:hypothetical protein QD460_05800 [Rhizobium jaguaris]|uniref:hypothetical protein n=1 Tax=Rhizobium jaguaris TaxID=1312183 RepID=UPI0039BF68C0